MEEKNVSLSIIMLDEIINLFSVKENSNVWNKK